MHKVFQNPTSRILNIPTIIRKKSKFQIVPNKNEIKKYFTEYFWSKLCNDFKNEQPVTHFWATNFCWDVDDDATAKPTNQRPARVAVTSLYLFRTGHKSAVRRWNTVRREAAGVITRDCYTATGPLSRGLYSYLSH